VDSANRINLILVDYLTLRLSNASDVVRGTGEQFEVTDHNREIWSTETSVTCIAGAIDIYHKEGRGAEPG
jgi:hypothetical protein